MKGLRKTAIVLVGLAALFAATASGTSSSINSSASSPSNGSTATTAATTAHTGAAISLSGSQGEKVNVTLVKVIDPAQGADQFTTPDAGKRFVGTDFTIASTGSATYSDDANNDATVIGSDNQTYTSAIASISECTNFASGTVTLANGESSTGCVAFQLPTGVTVSKVRFATNSGFGGESAEWLNP